MTAAQAPVPRAVAGRLPRALHPMAWWLWGLGLAAAADTTTNPLVLALILAVLATVVSNRRSDAPWARAFKYYLALATVVIAIRVVFRAVFTSTEGTHEHVLFRLPSIAAPSWYAGVHLGGPVSLEAVLAAASDGLRLGTFLCCVGAANVLANPKRALRALPGALYELGVAVVVALSVAPQLVESIQRVHRARLLRGTRARGLRSLRATVVPVLEDAFERSLFLAAAMDSRGYGRAGSAGPGTRRLTAVLMYAGMAGLCVGAYGLLDSSTPRPLGAAGLAAGAVLAATGLTLGGRRVRRTAYRSDPWLLPEWIVAGAGICCAIVLFLAARSNSGALSPTFSPLAWPQLPLVPTAAVLVAGLCGLAAPTPLRERA